MGGEPETSERGRFGWFGRAHSNGVRVAALIGRLPGPLVTVLPSAWPAFATQR